MPKIHNHFNSITPAHQRQFYKSVLKYLFWISKIKKD